MTSVLVSLALPGPGGALTFVDSQGVTHEALHTEHRIGAISLCGKFRYPTLVKETLDWIRTQVRAWACAEAPGGVDCMTCLVRRARLSAIMASSRVLTRMPSPMVELDLKVTSWV